MKSMNDVMKMQKFDKEDTHFDKKTKVDFY